jgi:prepilin-type N-terminal cleavage/methylation domain-containing protein
MNPKLKLQGFSLLEIAMALMIIALILGGLLPTLSSQINQRQTNETRKQLEEAREALLGYAVAKGHFPCPAKSALDGSEDRHANGACNSRQGYLPWSELGVAKLDAWGRIFRYSATPAFTNLTTPFKLAQARDITVKTRGSDGTIVNLSNAKDIPAVVISHGKNGYGATLEDGGMISNPATQNTDEQTNLPSSGTGIDFISREASTSVTASGGEFDDLVTWISPNTLFGKMVAAGQLP